MTEEHGISKRLELDNLKNMTQDLKKKVQDFDQEI